MEHLWNELDQLLSDLPNEDEFRRMLADLVSVYPFNQYEYVISKLLAAEILTLDRYIELRDEYIERNLYLYIFEITAPRKFGESWAQGHVKELVPKVRKPSRKVDREYTGQYDLYLEGIRIEVKASRAVDANSEAPLYDKALASDSEKPFLMNFQQVKPDCCDVFVWIAVWRDVIRYWVLSSSEVESNRYYSSRQHRGNVGEGQLHVTHDNIKEFECYKVKPNKVKKQSVRPITGNETLGNNMTLVWLKCNKS